MQALVSMLEQSVRRAAAVTPWRHFYIVIMHIEFLISRSFRMFWTVLSF